MTGCSGAFARRGQNQYISPSGPAGGRGGSSREEGERETVDPK